MRVISSWSMAMFVVFAAYLGSSPNAFAQSDLTSVVGIVYDPSGAVVPKANVTLKNQATGAERKANTNDNGAFSVTNVPAGAYTLIVEATGFKRFAQSGNQVVANVTTTLDATLNVGDAAETVTDG